MYCNFVATIKRQNLGCSALCALFKTTLTSRISHGDYLPNSHDKHQQISSQHKVESLHIDIIGITPPVTKSRFWTYYTFTFKNTFTSNPHDSFLDCYHGHNDFMQRRVQCNLNGYTRMFYNLCTHFCTCKPPLKYSSTTIQWLLSFSRQQKKLSFYHWLVYHQILIVLIHWYFVSFLRNSCSGLGIEEKFIINLL